MASAWKGRTVGVWLLAVLCASVWAELDSRLDQQWEQWKTTHQKKYHNEVEELGRRALWEKNLNDVNHHNLEASLGLHTYTLAINHMSDLTEDEMFSAPMKIPEDVTPTPLNDPDVDLPASVNWKEKGYVTSVKNQELHCDSCWAFSAAGALEGLLFKKTGKLVSLSPQNLMDCSKPYGSYGCSPGRLDSAFNYVKDNGIASEASYPYEARNGDCRYNSNMQVVTCSSIKLVLPMDELSLQKRVATIGPISAAIDQREMIHYNGGVFINPNCGKELNHAVLVVGYGRDEAANLDYWLIKNSYGTGWGEQGYMKLARNKDQMCGISMYAVYPL